MELFSALEYSPHVHISYSHISFSLTFHINWTKSLYFHNLEALHDARQCNMPVMNNIRLFPYIVLPRPLHGLLGHSYHFLFYIEILPNTFQYREASHSNIPIRIFQIHLQIFLPVLQFQLNVLKQSVFFPHLYVLYSP